MAKMYPPDFPQDNPSNAEKMLWHALKKELSDAYFVFHSVRWQSIGAYGRPRDGEADFVITHPLDGILVMEVKGGEILFQPNVQKRDQWKSKSSGGRVNTIKDPFEQAKVSKHVLLSTLSDMLEPRKPFMLNGHAVAFPESTVPEGITHMDKPREIILDQGDMATVAKWVEKTMTYWRGKDKPQSVRDGEKILVALTRLLNKPWHIKPAMWGEIRQEEEELLKLTEQQYIILSVLNGRRRALISGCAGSGKTMLATEKAIRLVDQNFKVLLTCFNNGLAEDLRENLPVSEKLDIKTFHALCLDFAKKANIHLPAEPKGYQEKERYFNETIPEILSKAADKLPDYRYDAIIVDEGQDFKDDWWIPLQLLLRDPDNGIFYIFYDDNQRIYNKQQAFPIEEVPFALTQNCRNTQSIHNKVINFYTAKDQLPTAIGPEGRPVQFVSYSTDEDDLLSTLSSTLTDLIRKEKVPTDEIVILSAVRQGSKIRPGAITSPVRLISVWPPDEPGEITATTIHKFKGLESAVVILAEIDKASLETEELHKLLYVACSRAKNHLIIMTPKNEATKIKLLFK